MRRERTWPIERKEVTTEMSAIPTYRSRGTPRKHTKRLWMTFIMLVLAIALASMAVVTAEAQTSSNSEGFPKQVLMKGNTELQNGKFNYGTWHWYEAGQWNTVHADGLRDSPRADLVRAGSWLHIRVNKPQRPESFTITAHPRSDQGWSDYGERPRLDTSLRRVMRDGKTVAWNVFFRVNRPDRHYYLQTYGRWERVPGTHISYGTSNWNFHVKTTD
jgi:hypothetical protein